jgi:hypothetical protein
MKIFSIGSSQTIDVTPRYESIADYDLEVYNEDNANTTTIDFSSLTVNSSTFPNLNITFSYTASDNQTFRLKLIDVSNNRVLWRGKAFTTSQTLQNYKINV